MGVYRDITTLLSDADGFQATIHAFARRYRPLRLTHIASCESRGFLFGAPLAIALNCGFVPIRRARRLPGPTLGVDYRAGFKMARLEVHQHALPPGSRVVIIDDIISTVRQSQP